MKNLSTKNIFGNFMFGKLQRSDIGISFNGIAVKNKEGKMVAYDGEDIIDVDLFNFDSSNALYALPVATDKVEKGDCIIHNNDPVFVKDIEKAKNGSVSFRVINPVRGEEVIIKPTKNMFGFNFITKIYSLFSISGQTASKENPFGNILPLMLLSDNSDSKLPLLMMLSQNKDFNFSNIMDKSNPMMSMLLMKSLFSDNGGSNDDDFFTMMLLQNLTGTTTSNWSETTTEI
jgi:hypothetical protein